MEQIMEQIMENEDIKRVIYSFGYPEHRFYMKDLSTRLNTNLEPIKEISDAWEYDQGEIGNSMSYYIQCRFTKDQMIQMYHKTRRCYCCTRHAHYKPDLLRRELNSNNSPNDQPEYSYNEECYCNCRHMCRHVYRAYTNKFG
jgi:hypothetical protein